jgi:hypothetical protein
MELTRILDACQGDRLDDWRIIPGSDAPDTNLLAAVFDAGDQSGPALAALPHLHRAVYMPDARMGLGWGMELEDWRDRRPRTKPDWASHDWNSAEPNLAHILFNGAMVWRVLYTYIDRGAGRDGILPYPARKFEPGPTPPYATPGGWDTTHPSPRWSRMVLYIKRGGTARTARPRHHETRS